MVVAIAASTGGPEALERLLLRVPAPCSAAIIVVQHGPAWMMHTLCRRLGRVTRHTVQLATPHITPSAGNVYIAPGEHHLVVDREGRMQLNDDPPENGVRPAADPLFRSLATYYGAQCIAVILTGLGRDGALGAKNIKAANGHVIAQDPATATAPFMPEAVVALGLVPRALTLNTIPGELQLEIRSRKHLSPDNSMFKKHH